MQVCVRLRPVLPPSETDQAWRVNNNGKSITSLVSDIDRESLYESNSVSSRFNIGSFGVNFRERELKRRFNEIS